MKIVEQKIEEYQDYKSINQDPYGKEIVEFSERWADLMELAIEQGIEIKDVVNKLCREADTSGITGYMYSCAVQGLSYFWIHGEILRKWHNGECGAPNSEGVVNTAIIIIGEKK